MKYTLDRFEQELSDAIAATGKVAPAQIELVAPKPNIPADRSFPTFRAAKEQQMPPPQLAQQLASSLSFGANSLVGDVVATGPFLNVSLNPSAFAAAVLGEVQQLGERYGSDDLGNGKTVIIDYSSPNVAKLMHVGHIRSTIIGQSLLKIHQFLGYNVIGDNHLGDWGKQFGMNIAAVVKWGRPEGDNEEALAAMDKLYSQYANMVKAEKEQGITTLDDEARAWSLKLEQGDPLARELWQWMVDMTLRANKSNYDRLGVRFDHHYGESFYEPMLGGVIEHAIQSGVAYRDEKGAVVVDELEKHLPTFLLQRSDGGTLYLTRDMATIQFRIDTFHPSRIVYVVGMPQELHFRQLFALARATGYGAGVEFEHVKFGTVYDQAGQPLSTRRGNMIYLSDLLNDAHARAKDVVDKTSPELPEDERHAIAEMVGIGAVIYNDLYQDSKRNITVDWDRMLALEGNSAPYIQYMYARCRSILRKAAEDTTALPDLSPEQAAALLTHPSEQAVVKHIAKLPQVVREAADRYATPLVADWCYEMARALSAFYRDCPVLKAEPELRAARLLLVASTAQSLKNGLALLGINAPERM